MGEESAGLPRPHDEFVTHLELARTESPCGSDATLTVAVATEKESTHV